MGAPLLDLKSQNLPLEAELKAAFERVLRSGQYILGPEVEAFEKEIALYTGAKHAVALSSGTDAILVALMALGIGPGDEVLCPAFTFFATAGCIARVGARPVFVDALESDYNLDLDDAARKVTSRTKAIMPVHLFGQSAEMDAVCALAKTHNLAVIEDAAQSLGAKYQGRAAGTIGTFGTYSFFPTKNLGCLGDAGMLVTHDAALAEKGRWLRNHGSEVRYYHKLVGGNFRIDALQAALLRVKLPLLDLYSEKRRTNARSYLAELHHPPPVALASQPETWPAAKLILPVENPGNDHVWNQFTIRVRSGQRDHLREFLKTRGIASEIYYPVPLHAQECFQALGQTEQCPVASRLATEVLSLPVSSELSPQDGSTVIEAIKAFLNILNK